MATVPSAATGLSFGVRAFEQNSAALAANAERLASGRRILQIGDDSAAISIAAGLRAQLVRQRAAQQNTAEASGLLGTAQQGLERIGSALAALRDIATQASGNGITESDRALLAAQFTDTLGQIDAIARDTRFNGTPLLDGSFAARIPFGDDSNDAIALAIDDSSAAALFQGVTPSLATAPDARDATDAVTDARERFGRIEAAVAGLSQRVELAAEATARNRGGISIAYASLTEADIPAELSRQAATRLRQDTATSVIVQSQQLNSDLLALVELPITPLPERARPDAAAEAGVAETPTRAGTAQTPNAANADRSNGTAAGGSQTSGE